MFDVAFSLLWSPLFLQHESLSPCLWLLPGGPVICHYLPDRVPGADIYVYKLDVSLDTFLERARKSECSLSSSLSPDVRSTFITVIDHQSSLLALEWSMTVMNGDIRVLGSPAQSRALSGYRILLNLCSIKMTLWNNDTDVVQKVNFF